MYTFGSTLANRYRPENFVSPAAFEAYAAKNPHNEMHHVYPIDDGSWMDANTPELVSLEAEELVLRGRKIRIPNAEDCRRVGVPISGPPRVQVFELCRAIAYSIREDVLATPDERRTHVPLELRLLLTLDERPPGLTTASLKSEVCSRSCAIQTIPARRRSAARSHAGPSPIPYASMCSPRPTSAVFQFRPSQPLPNPPSAGKGSGKRRQCALQAGRTSQHALAQLAGRRHSLGNRPPRRSRHFQRLPFRGLTKRKPALHQHGSPVQRWAIRLASSLRFVAISV